MSRVPEIGTMIFNPLPSLGKRSIVGREKFTPKPIIACRNRLAPTRFRLSMAGWLLRSDGTSVLHDACISWQWGPWSANLRGIESMIEMIEEDPGQRQMGKQLPTGGGRRRLSVWYMCLFPPPPTDQTRDMVHWGKMSMARPSLRFAHFLQRHDDNPAAMRCTHYRLLLCPSLQTHIHMDGQTDSPD